MLDGKQVTLRSSSLNVDILKYSGTVARLSPSADPNLDSTPGDRLKKRSADTFYHLGDLDLRFRAAGSSGWTDVSTAFHREEATVLQSDNDRCVTVLDSSRDRLFIAPFGLRITLDAGHLDSADFDPKTHVVGLHLGAATASVPVGRVRLTQTVPGSISRAWTIASKPPLDAGANVIQFGRRRRPLSCRKPNSSASPLVRPKASLEGR